jgi:hypothetical protein
MTESNFFNRDDDAAIEALERIFNKKGIFFIEHNETRQWYVCLKDYKEQWTNDPLKAMRFETEGRAMTYKIKLGIRNTIVTEHEFDSPPRDGGN